MHMHTTAGSPTETCVAAGKACAPPALCIVTMHSGSQTHRIEQQQVTLDEDAYLILQGPAACAAGWHSPPGARAFVLRFDAATLAGAAVPSAPDGVGFLPHLRPHGDAVSQRLRRLAQQVEAGTTPAFEQRRAMAGVLQAAVQCERDLRQRADRIDSVKPATRWALFRRVWRASDFILSHYEQPLTLEQMASEARLSPFHFARLFARVHDITPHAYLLRKRLTVARRLLARTHCDLDEVAARAGFNTRSSLFRNVRKHLGCGGGALRGATELQGEERDSTCPTSA